MEIQLLNPGDIGFPRLEKLMRSKSLALEVLNDDKFLKKVEALQGKTFYPPRWKVWQGPTYHKYFSFTEITPKQLAREVLPAAEIGLKFHVYHSWNPFSKAIAFEDKNGIHLRDTFFDNSSHYSLAATIAHESMHAIGFIHDFYATNIRSMSVPYVIGDMVLEFLDPTWKN